MTVAVRARAGRSSLAPVSDDARQGHFDLGKWNVASAGQQRGGHFRLARTHNVLHRRLSAVIIANASRGPHSPAS